MKRLALIALLTLVGAVAPVSHPAAASARWPVVPSPYRLACPATPLHCDAMVSTGMNADAGTAYTPAQFHSAYNLPCRPYGRVRAVCSQPHRFGGQTIAIVDAGGDKRIGPDLNLFDQKFGLPACTKTNGCIRIVNQRGATTPLPPGAGWGVETALDVETVHAICQTCRILLVESDTAMNDSMAAAVDTAVRLGATEVSNSYGGGDSAAYAASYNHPGVAIVASTGDEGWGAQSPASLSTVIAAGGTTLHLNADGSYAGETAWNGSGSGCSYVNPAQRWQHRVKNWSATGCGSYRGIADVAADADPNTGAQIVAHGVWYRVGGTSLSAPLIAGIIALAGGVAGKHNAQSVAYHRFNASNSHDVLTGSNGPCGSSMCHAGSGYDGPTGLGSPNGIDGFEVHPKPAPPVTPTPTATPQPTGTPVPTNPVPPTPRGATATPVPTNTAVPRPTVAPSPLPTATTGPTAVLLPTATPIPTNDPVQYELALLNGTRSAYGLPPYSLNDTESNGTATCVGSYGHSVHMQQMGTISHDQFPADICVPYYSAGENVGEYGGLSVDGALSGIHQLMMSEPHDAATCASTTNHACNILSPTFRQIGIGVYTANGTTWLTTDFVA